MGNNFAGRQGGALYNSGGTVLLVDSTISNNTAALGGGIYNTNNGTLSLSSTVVGDNVANCGGICMLTMAQ
jgi:hypothetical protein